MSHLRNVRHCSDAGILAPGRIPASEARIGGGQRAQVLIADRIAQLYDHRNDTIYPSHPMLETLSNALGAAIDAW